MATLYARELVKNFGNKKVVKGIDICVKQGEVVGLLGPNGAGKTTTFYMLVGIIKPTQGTVFIDDIEITSWPLHRRAKHGLSYLPQESFLFHDTIRNNILWGKPDAPDEEIKAALKLASAYDFVNKLPDGLDTVVKDRGQRLSGGERQRIALARTLIRNPQLLLLDEATSSLDMENESRISESISKLHGKMTIVFITHRPETLKFADKAININEIFAKSQADS